MGYRIVDISKRPNASTPTRWRLHIERVEVQTVDSLDARNHEFYELAAKMNLYSYDGMDVGSAPPN